MSVQAREVIVIPATNGSACGATKGNHIDSTIQKKLRVASYSRVFTDFDEQISIFTIKRHITPLEKVKNGQQPKSVPS